VILSATANPTSPALYDSAQRRWWSYGELADTASKLTESLRFSRKALIFSFCQNTPISVAWYLAAAQAKHAVVLLSADLAPDLRATLVATYKPDLLLAARDLGGGPAANGMADYEALPGGTGPAYIWHRKVEHPHVVHPDLAVLLSTSGSTGSPKLVRLSSKNVESNAQAISQALNINSQSRAITSLPFHYSYGLSVLNTHLFMGASLVMTDDSLTAASFWDLFRMMECQSFAGVPYSYEILRRLDVFKLAGPTLSVMTQAGGKLQRELVAHFHRIMAASKGLFFVMYGQTEATARISVLPPSFLPEKLGSVGVSIPGGSLALKVDNAITREAKQSGELVYSGPNVMMGYATGPGDIGLGDVLGGTLYTGDLAHFDDDGFVYIDGRMKRDAKIFGLRVSLDEIEDILRVHGPTAVVAHNEKLLVYCEYGDESEFGRIRQELANKLMVHHSAFHFRRLERIPTNSSGKIDYAELKSWNS